MIFQGEERETFKEQWRSRVSEGERNQRSLRLETRIPKNLDEVLSWEEMCSDLVKRNMGYCDGVVWRGTRTEARILARTSLQYLSQNMLSFCRWSRKESKMTSKFLVWSTGSSELPLSKTKSKERKDLGRTYGLASPVSCWPFLNSSCWWWLVSSMFLTRTSCHKVTHPNGYYGTWPEGAVLISGSPNTPMLLNCSYHAYVHIPLSQVKKMTD